MRSVAWEVQSDLSDLIVSPTQPVQKMQNMQTTQAQMLQTIQVSTQEQRHLSTQMQPLGDEIAAPVVLTARTLLEARDDITSGLCDAQFELRYVAAWNRLPEAIERIKADVVLVDMDATDPLENERQRISGYRLVSLLAQQVRRQKAERPIALVLMTRLDFTEIEELARAGVHAIISPMAEAPAVVEQVCSALHTARKCHAPLQKQSTASEDMPRYAGVTNTDSPKSGRQEAESGWHLSDHLWQRIEVLLPASRHAKHTRTLDRRALEAIFFVLHSGTPWSRLPAQFGSATSVRTRLRQWTACGVTESLLAVGLGEQTTWGRLHWKRLSGVFPPLVAQLAKTKDYRIAQ